MWSKQFFLLSIAVCVGHTSAFHYGAALNRVSAGPSPGISSRGCTLVASPGMKLRSGGGAFTDLSLEGRAGLRRGGAAGPVMMSETDSDGKIRVVDGDVVGVTYKGTLDDGEVFDQNEDGPLLEFEVGSGRVIKGFDDAVRGLAVGESRKVRCEPKDAYGDYEDDNVATVPMSNMPEPPEGLKMEPGMVMQLTTGQIAVITEVNEDTVTLDGNHPLAGKTLNFEVKLGTIMDKKEAEEKKVEEMNGVLSNPLLALVAQEVLQNPTYISDLKADLEKSDNKGEFINGVLASPEWRSVNEALMANPELMKLVRDPAALAKMAESMSGQDPDKVVEEFTNSNVVEAEFSDDA